MAYEANAGTDRLTDVLGIALDALEMLDQAVGRGATLPVRDRERVREYLMPPRNHLRSCTETLRQMLEMERRKREALRAG